MEMDGGKMTTVRQLRQTLVMVRVTFEVSSVTGRSLAGVVDYDDASRVVVLVRQASRWLGGGLA
jgi:hypothetical protein